MIRFGCLHLLDLVRLNDEKKLEEIGYYRHFTGQGMNYQILCSDCGKLAEEKMAIQVQPFTVVEFEKVKQECILYGLVGEPEVLISSQQLEIDFSYDSYMRLQDQVILDIQPYAHEEDTPWIAVTAAGSLIKIKEGSNFVEISEPLDGPVDFTRSVVMRISPNQKYLAIANKFGTEGCVVDLQTESICLKLKRDDYHKERCHFPIDFLEKDGKTLLIYATHWNRLDVVDVETGKYLTERQCSAQEGGESASHKLDYFHGDLLVSPHSSWLLDSGWVWQPVGMPFVFNLNDWLSKNIWESEDGPSKRTLALLDYWPSAACWVDDQTLIFDGLEGDFQTSHGVRLIDVKSGETLKNFAGPNGNFFFDRYLFCTSTHGFTGWNIHTGERVLEDLSFRPIRYHSQKKQFLSLLPNNTLQFGRIKI